MSISGLRGSAGRGLEMLIIGDSLDRMMVHDWCEHMASFHPRKIENDSIINDDLESADYKLSTWLSFPNNWTEIHKYDHELYLEIIHRYEQGFRCRDPRTGDMLTMAHIYGSCDVGPYFRNFSNDNLGFSYVDTKPRVEFILENYLNKFGFPDVVIFHSTQWDVKPIWMGHDNFIQEHWYEHLEKFRKNVNRRIDQIELILSNYLENSYDDRHIRIGLRTSVVNRDIVERELVHTFNDITRSIAMDRRLILFDYNSDVWSVENFNYNSSTYEHLFRDFVHPNMKRSILAAEKILGRRYTNALHNYGLHEQRISSHMRTDEKALSHQLKRVRVNLILSDRQLYFIHGSYHHHHSCGRWLVDNDAMPILNHILELGSTDVLKWPNDSAVKEATVDRGIFPFNHIVNETCMYILTLLQRENNNSQQTLCALVFQGSFLIIQESSDWDRWINVTNPNAILVKPLEPFWSQHEHSVLFHREDLDSSRQPGHIYW